MAIDSLPGLGPSGTEGVKNISDIGAVQKNLAGGVSGTYSDLFGQLMDQLGYTKDPTGKIVADPNNPATQIRTANQQKLLASYGGTAQADPTLERSLAESEHKLRSELENNLGPGYETSSAGIAALGEAKKNAAMARFSANQEVQKNAGAANQQNISNISNAGSTLTGNTGTIANIYGSAGETYGKNVATSLQEQAMQNQINIKNAEIEQSGQNALMGGIGQLAGAGAGAYATYAALL